MLNRENQVRACLVAAFLELGISIDVGDFKVERPARREHGDFSTNAALVVSKKLSRSPREVAELLAGSTALSTMAHLSKIEVAGPGFVNLYLAPSHLHELLGEVISEGEDRFAKLTFGAGVKVMIEFVSTNPTGPIHIGNGWWASYGDALAKVFTRCGYAVSKEYYVNDTGGQIRALGASILARMEGEAPPEGGYLGEYVVEQAARYQGERTVEAAGRWAAEENLKVIKESLERLGIHFDVWFSQASIEESGAVDETIGELAKADSLFESEGALWLETTKFGDSRDRVIRKSNGDFTYFAGDIAYHRNKFLVRGFDIVIDVFGADHHGQVASLKAAMVPLGISPERLEIRLGQMVSLRDDDQIVKFSKRMGIAISLEWLLDEVGPAVTRILSLSSSIDRSMTIDLKEAKANSMENPAYYIQYAYARICSLDRTRASRGIAKLALSAVDLSVLIHPREIRLMEDLVVLPEVVEQSCRERAPHKLVTWLTSVASSFHGFYHDCPILSGLESEDIIQGRLQLVEGARIAMKVALDLIGVEAVEEM